MILFQDTEDEMYVDDRIIHFAMIMQKEIDENEKTKQKFFEQWMKETSFPIWLYEFEYHKAKLIAALMAKNKEQITEFVGDLGNYLSGLLFRDFDLQKSFTLTESNIKII